VSNPIASVYAKRITALNVAVNLPVEGAVVWLFVEIGTKLDRGKHKEIMGQCHDDAMATHAE
jgi:hypothetical protein